MKSFPSALTKDDLVQPGKLVSTNLQTTLKNMAGALMNKSLGGSEVSKAELGSLLKWEDADYKKSIDENTINFTTPKPADNLMIGLNNVLTDKVLSSFHENMRRIPALTLIAANKYRKVYINTACQVGGLAKNDEGKLVREYYSQGVAPSLFNGMYGVPVQGITVNTPLMTSSSINYDEYSLAEGTYIAKSDAMRKQEAFNEASPEEKKKMIAQAAANNADEIKRQEEAKGNNDAEILRLEGEKNKISLSDEEKKNKTEEEQKALLRQKQQLIDAEINRLTANNTNINAYINYLKNPYEGQQFASIHGIGTAIDLVKDRPEALLSDLDQNGIKNETLHVQVNNDDFDFTDCSIRTLVNLSNGKNADGSTILSKRVLGRAVYRYADFMYCKDLGKVSNNHLITLRKFDKPIGDNIFRLPGNVSDLEIASTARLVSWFGTDDNKLEDICKYNYKATWKQLEAKLDDVQSKEDDGRLLPSIANIISPTFNKEEKNSGNNRNNMFYNFIAGKAGFLFATEGGLGNDIYYKDANKIYTPRNTIQSTHIYEGKLEFSHQFTLKFSYVLRSYDGINPKSAFLDLIGNILEVTYAHGTFWGGGRRWLGAPRNQKAWKTINSLYDKLDKGIHGSINSLFGCSSLEDLGSLCSNVLQSVGNFLKGAYNKVNQTLNTQGKSLARKGAHAVADGLQGMLKNKLGRPAVYALDSLLNDKNVGLWHVTIGNPRNPIMAMGNLILDNAEISHSGPLGIDDFPTEISVSVTLKHAKPRDAQMIGEMYTCGQGGIIIPLTGKQKGVFFDTSEPDEALGIRGYGQWTADDIERMWESKN